MNISASPYHHGKGAQRERMLVQRARDSLAYVAFCNLVGGQDELVFDGYSLVVDQDGELVARGAQFREELIVCDIDPSTADAARLRDARHRPAARVRRPAVTDLGHLDAPARHEATAVGGPRAKPLEVDEEVYEALCLGLRDYVDKNGFERVLLGLSGGIDSALTACVAADALGSGPGRMCGDALPPLLARDPERRPHAGGQPRDRPRRDAARAAHGGLRRVLSEPFKGTETGIAEENIQARIRGNLLMALSNKFGWLVLTTGNKSEYSVGYTTLYGDMAGGFGVLKDVPKTLVYRLAHYRNGLGQHPVIPAPIVERPPVGRAAPRPAGHGQPAPLRPARRDPRGLRRGGPGPRPADPPRHARGRRGPRDPHGRRGRVQAAPGAARHQDHAKGVRPRQAAADHEPVPGRSRTRRR